MLGFAMHNTAYRVTVQWRYGVYMKGERGPFQTSITINVQNLVVSSPDETKVLKWDPVRGIADTTFSYSLECAQRKWCQVQISIYSTDGMKVYEEWLEQMAPGSYNFTWDGSVNVVPPPPPPDGKAPAGLYVFDIEVIGVAPGYDEDWLRSRVLEIGDHDVVTIGLNLYRVGYILYSYRDASDAWVEVWDPELMRIAGPIHSDIHAIPPDKIPQEGDGNFVDIKVQLNLGSDDSYRFVFWAQDNFHDWYKNHHNKYAFTNQQRKVIGCALITGHFYQKGFGPWIGLLRDLNSTAFAGDVEKMVRNVVAQVREVGKKWFILPEWQVTLIVEYSTNLNCSKHGHSFLKYTSNEGATEFKRLLEELTHTSGSHVVHFWGHACPGIIGFPDDNGQTYYFGFCAAKPANFGCVDISTVINPLNPWDPKPLRNIRVVYLGGCNSFLNPCLPQGFVDKGAQSAVGWKVTLYSFFPFRDNAPHRAFWYTLCGDKTKKIVGKTVQEAADAAASTYRGLIDFNWPSFRPSLSTYIGVVGNGGVKLY